jgi:protein ImuA
MSILSKNIIQNLKQDMLRWEGYKPTVSTKNESIYLGEIEKNFPMNRFPIGAVHEFVCGNVGQAVASSAFVAGLLSGLMLKGGACLWIGTSPVYPQSLSTFGIAPDRVIFIHLTKSKDILWAIEESLNCTGLAAVVGEVSELDFKQSRRLQLAVEKSGVTGFVMRNLTANKNNTACSARWQLSALPSENPDGLPGVGFYKWKVELLKVRNGQTGVWALEWKKNRFNVVPSTAILHEKLMVG